MIQPTTNNRKIKQISLVGLDRKTMKLKTMKKKIMKIKIMNIKTNKEILTGLDQIKKKISKRTTIKSKMTTVFLTC